MGVWETLRGELATADGREFERKALPLLRLFHCDMIQPTEMKTLDRAGIDLLVWSDDFKFPWAVQCKGFKEVDLGESQIKQILASIRKFANSPYSCDHYVLLHNRTSQNREATKLIRESLAHLLQSGKASTVHLWDRQKFIVEVQSRLRGLILERMQSDAISALQQHEAIFRFGSVYIPIVPVSEKRVVMRRGERMRLEDTGGPIDLTPISGWSSMDYANGTFWNRQDNHSASRCANGRSSNNLCESRSYD